MLSQYRDSTTYFMHGDHLVSARLLTKMDKSVYDSLDFLPFGEQIAGSSGTSHKFTGRVSGFVLANPELKNERDSESTLDHTLFRKYSSSLGRWTSPDPAGFLAADASNPQSWNGYTYVLNNPLALVDPSGLDPCQGANVFEFSEAANGTGIFTPEDCAANGGTWGDPGNGGTWGNGFLNGPGGNTPSGNGPPSGADNTPGCVWVQTDPLGIAPPTLNCDTGGSSGPGLIPAGGNNPLVSQVSAFTEGPVGRTI